MSLQKENLADGREHGGTAGGNQKIEGRTCISEKFPEDGDAEPENCMSVIWE